VRIVVGFFAAFEITDFAKEKIGIFWHFSCILLVYKKMPKSFSQNIYKKSEKIIVTNFSTLKTKLEHYALK
jgi:hypothetical protein